MEKRQLGESGLWVSVVGLGTNNFGLRDDVDASSVVSAALDQGINFFDSAESYGQGKAEEALGQALVGRRQDAIIATKWGSTRNPPLGMGSRAYIVAACDRSLQRLRTDYIDVYHLHAPDPNIPIAETIRVLDDLVHQGKVRYYALSGSPAWRIVEAQLTARQLGAPPFVATQDHYSLLRRDIVEGDRLTVIQKFKMSLFPFFPLAGGLLSGKYSRSEPYPPGSRFAELKDLSRAFTEDRMWALTDQLRGFAEQRGHTILELALSWLLHRPAVTSVMTGATSAHQVVANVAAATWKLSPDDLTLVDRITSGTKAV